MSSQNIPSSPSTAHTPGKDQNGRPTFSFDPSFRRAAAVIALAATVVVVLLFLWTVAHVLLLAFAAILLAVFLHGLAQRLHAHSPLAYGWSLAVVVLALLGLLTLAGWLLAPSIADEIGALREVLPESVNRLQEQLSQYGWGEFLVDRFPTAKELMNADGTGFWSRATGFLSTAVGVLANVLVIVVVGIYLAANPGLYQRGLVRLFPADKEQRARETLQAVGQALWGWLLGQLISMTLVGVLVWLGLMLVRVPLPLGLGFIAGLAEFVPLIGPWVGAVPGLLVALMEAPTTMLYAGGVYLAVQQLESNVITPLVMKKAASLPPALTILATLIGGALFGIGGILLATPLAVMGMVLVQKVYVEGVLDKSVATPADA